MPTATASKTRKAPRRVVTKKSMGVTAMNDVRPVEWKPSVCRACNSLPVGSIELTSLMLVLIFSLTAVLFTSVYALRLEQNKVAALEAQVAPAAADSVR